MLIYTCKEAMFMKCTVILDADREEEVIIYAHSHNEIIEAIKNITDGNTKELNGYLRGEIFKLNIKDIYLFTIEDSKLYAYSESQKYLIKTRLCNIENLLDNNFVKINKSSIANISKIQKFDASIYGTLKVVFKNGQIDYVSRRNLKKVKERLGL